MWWKLRSPHRGDAESCTRRLNVVEDRLDRLEMQLQLDRVKILDSMEKVGHSLMQRMNKRAERSAEKPPEDAPGDTIVPPSISNYPLRSARRSVRGW